MKWVDRNTKFPNTGGYLMAIFSRFKIELLKITYTVKRTVNEPQFHLAAINLTLGHHLNFYDIHIKSNINSRLRYWQEM